jgi:pyrroline-5-carboxylate reductase
VKALLQPLGLVEEVPEALFDVVTAVSGSGPAFLALAVEGIEDGAVAAGLGRSAARELIRQSMLDMARRLAHHLYSAAELKEQSLRSGSMNPAVTKILDDRGIEAAFRQAVATAMARSREMAKA